MRERVILAALFVGMIAVLVILNMLSYSHQPVEPDQEATANRSTFNSGTTGTQALFLLLTETGRTTMRWQQPTADLVHNSRYSDAVLVIIDPRKAVSEDESRELIDWVRTGGRLVLIDRDPAHQFMAVSSSWSVINAESTLLNWNADPANVAEMTKDIPAALPVMPSELAYGVNGVQPSRFSSSFSAAFIESEVDDAIPPPVVHYAGGGKNVVLRQQIDGGSITFIADPFIASNTGLKLADNVQLMLNLFPNDSTIIFDEFHHGYGSGGSHLVQFFNGTPVIAIFLQLCLVALVFFVSRSVRFARAVPAAEPDRRSKLEYVAAMAELQQRTKAYDLAVEMIYKEFRRRTSRLLGVDNTRGSSHDLAQLIAERIKADPGDVERLMQKCEDIMYGERTSSSETLSVIEQIRTIESKLGLKRDRDTAVRS